jgi:hypothetical protein
MWLFLGILAVLAAANGSSRSSEASAAGVAPESPARTLTYRSRDGGSFFRFGITQHDGIRIYILEFPNPQIGSCHILRDSHGPYICWSQAIRSITEAKAVAAMWAESTLVYQRIGRTF